MQGINTGIGALKAWRLGSQRLDAQRWQSPAEVVAGLGGVQAQDYRWAKWSIGLRSDGRTDAQVERAMQERRIVRTWMFRGTLHFVAAADLAWLTALVAPGIVRRNARRYRELELDDAAFVKSQTVLQHALEENRALIRAEIKAHFEAAGVPAAGQQLPYLLQRAALDGLTCHGLLRGSEPTYVLVSDWAGAQVTLDQTEALGQLARRYWASHGPATAQDFGWWSGLTAKEVRLALEAAPEIVPLEIGGVRLWATGDPPAAALAQIAHLLPPFDDYLLGYKERSLVLDPSFAKRVNPGGGMLKPATLVNGEVVGVWRYKMKKQKMTVTVQPFRALAAQECNLIERAASQLGSFLSLAVDVRIAASHVG